MADSLEIIPFAIVVFVALIAMALLVAAFANVPGLMTLCMACTAAGLVVALTIELVYFNELRGHEQ